MFEDFDLRERPITAEHVLRVCQEWHDQEVADGETELEDPLTFQSKIAEWRDADEVGTWRNLARAMNGYWSISVPKAEWKAVLCPAGKRTLGGVCELIARHAKVAEIPDVTILGRRCREAGAFLAVRKILTDAGANSEEITPSTSLDRYAKRYGRVFNGPIRKLAPGMLPAVRVDHPIYNFTNYGIGITFLFVGFSFLVGDPWLKAIAISLLVVFWFGSYLATLLPPRRVAIGDLRTFRDLANALAANEPTQSTAVRYL
ncbi:MAG TPA: hypothetical protein VH107_04035 [Lacipirellulaceae bacterium]|jgi:hypothetical protein|nr:hypothetical protein [Lacipirellulaceae bacterium]